jgi:hypothetical protein
LVINEGKMNAQHIDKEDSVRDEGHGTWFCGLCGEIYYHKFRAEECCKEDIKEREHWGMPHLPI